jgi:uncharacterized protein with ParB-like and HNH nuclease domain
MEAKARSITFLSGEGSIVIPFFQRGYVWDENNWNDLFEDLLNNKSSQFLGSLIFKQQPTRTGEIKNVLVIDGQQRLTTLSILLKSLYDIFPADLKHNAFSNMLSLLYYKHYPTDSDYQTKIVHSRIDSDYYKLVIGDVKDGSLTTMTPNEFESINDKSNKIQRCYKFFCEKITPLNITQQKELFNRLLNDENKIVVVIDLSPHDNEQAIFDTINSAGVRLTGTDTVKNALFQKAMEFMDVKEVVNLYDLYWDKTFTIDEDTILFWGEEKLVGRLKRVNSEIFLHAYAVIKDIFDPDENTLDQLSDLYKEEFKKYNNKENIEGFLKELIGYAIIYRSRIPIFENNTLFSYSDDIYRLFHILVNCDISTFHPYIMFLFNKHKDNENILKCKLKELESYVIRNMIIGGDAKSYNKLCKEFIIKDNLASKLSDIKNDDILANLEKINNRNASLLLFWIELYRRNADVKESIKELKYTYSLEHIMPQKWEEHWSSMIIVDDSGNDIVDTELAKKHRNTRIYSLGNMTLLNSRLNTSLRNYSLERKIEGEGRKKGIRYYGELSITKRDILENYDSGVRTWNEKNILDRTKQLSNEILEIWC